ncbi:MAG: phosphatidate cytidylyltransferase [Firmicutes bacterium]|nr:phosphatidate cytidylyltransferase [Bacillota bacterium]
MFDWQKERTKRLVTGFIILCVLAAAFGLRQVTPFIFDGFVIILVWFCVFEVFKAKKLDSRGVRDYYIYPYIAISYLTFLLGILVDNPFPFWLHIVLQLVILFVLCLYVYIMSYTDKEFLKECKLKKKDVGKASFGVVLDYMKLIFYPAFLLFLLVPINHIARWAEVIPEGTVDAVPVVSLGLFALLLVFVITIMTDTAAYLTGKLLKGKKLVPKISPGKTISGAVGGLFGGVIGSLTVLLVMTTSTTLQQFLTEQVGYANAVLWVFAVIGLVGAVITQAGDIYASWVKRKNGIKDFGKWLPGHGGLMDRFDGLAFNSAFIAFVFMIIVLV